MCVCDCLYTGEKSNKTRFILEGAMVLSVFTSTVYAYSICRIQKKTECELMEVAEDAQGSKHEQMKKEKVYMLSTQSTNSHAIHQKFMLVLF